jgi:ATP-dependent RNA helicase RhlE
LKVEGFRAGVLHGWMAQSAREKSLGQLAAGVNDVLVATELAARGLDLEHITHVINFDPPADEKDYLQLVGRTARAGRTGTGITLVTKEKRAELGEIAKVLELRKELGDAGPRMDAPRSAQPPSGNRSRLRRPR